MPSHLPEEYFVLGSASVMALEVGASCEALREGLLSFAPLEHRCRVSKQLVVERIQKSEEGRRQ